MAHFGTETPLTEITPPRIARYRLGRLTVKSERTGRKLAAASVNRELNFLQAILRPAADEECGYLEKAPRVRLEKEPEGQLRYLTDDARAAAPKPPALPGRRAAPLTEITPPRIARLRELASRISTSTIAATTSRASS